MASVSNGARQAGNLQGLALALPITLPVMGSAMLAPVLPQMLDYFKDVPNYEALVPILIGIQAIFIAIFAAPAGALADIVGRRRLLIIGMVLYAFAGIAPIFLDNLYVILVTRMFVGIAEAVVMTCGTTMIGDLFQGRQREKWLATQSAISAIAAVFLFAIAGYLGNYGWRAPFGMYATALILALGVGLFTWEPVPHESEPVMAPGVRANFPWGHVLGVCAITIAGAILFYTFALELSIAFTEVGVTKPSTIGMLTALATIGVPVGTIFFRMLTRYSVWTLLTLEFGLIGLGFYLAAHAPDYRSLICAVVINQLGCGMMLPTLLNWAMRPLHYSMRGRGTGFWMAAFNIGQFGCVLVVPALMRGNGGHLIPALTPLAYAAFALAGGAFLWQILMGAKLSPDSEL